MDNLRKKINCGAMTTLLLVVGCLISGCALNGKSLTTSGYVMEPRMAYDGSDFGIVYYHGSTPGAAPSIKIVKANSAGNVLASNNVVAKVNSTTNTPFRLSDLVWNSNDKQFAFGYSTGKVIYFVRLNPNLKIIGTPLEIKFKLLPYEHPYLEDLSLIWCADRKEYTLTYITKEHAASAGTHDNIYCSHISPAGKFVPPLERRILVKGQKNCKRTSVAYNPKTKKYAVAYFKDSIPMLGIFGATGYASEHLLTSSTYKPWREAIRLIYDDKTGDFFVTELSYGGELICYFVDKNGALPTKYFNEGKGYDNLFATASMSPFEAIFLCASQYKQIRCWAMNKSGDIKPDMVSPTTGVYSSEPSVAIVGLTPYMCWIQKQQLYFGHPEL